MGTTNENQEQENQTNTNIKWADIALQACITVGSAMLGGFAAALGAHAFSKLVNRQPSLTGLDNVVELKSKLG